MSPPFFRNASDLIRDTLLLRRVGLRKMFAGIFRRREKEGQEPRTAVSHGPRRGMARDPHRAAANQTTIGWKRTAIARAEVPPQHKIVAAAAGEHLHRSK